MINLNDEAEILSAVQKVESFVDWLKSQLDGVRDPDVLSETLNPFGRLDAEVSAQILMELMNETLGQFDSDEKMRWVKIAAHMGPDWIEKMRVLAAFMQMVDGFQPRRS